MDYTEIAEKHGATQGFLGGTPAHQDNMTYLFTRKELTAYSKEIERLALERAKREFGAMGMKGSVKAIRKLIEELEE